MKICSTVLNPGKLSVIACMGILKSRANFGGRGSFFVWMHSTLWVWQFGSAGLDRSGRRQRRRRRRRFWREWRSVHSASGFSQLSAQTARRESSVTSHATASAAFRHRNADAVRAKNGSASRAEQRSLDHSVAGIGLHVIARPCREPARVQSLRSHAREG